MVCTLNLVKSDLDRWIRLVSIYDGALYCQLVLPYIDDIFAIMEELERFLRKELGARFILKVNSIGPPTQDLGNKVSQVTLDNCTKVWALIYSHYIQNAVNNVEYFLHKKGEKLTAHSNSPWSRKYIPETAVSPEILSTNATYF